MTVQDLLEVPPRTLYRQMASIFVPHPRFMRIMEEVRLILSLQDCDDEAPCLQVSGPPGSASRRCARSWRRNTKLFPMAV